MALTPKEHLRMILEEQESERRNGLTLADLPEPSMIPGMYQAAKRIIERLEAGDRLLIVGDYDADGIMATTITMLFFRDTKYANQVDYIVPDRFVDGYGVSKNMIDYAIKHNFDFIVTVDNGIGAKEAVAYGTEKGIEVIITDHHTPGDAVPEVDIIVDLKYNAGDFPFIEISGATMAWYLCAEIREQLDLEIDMRDYIDLVAITVISDVMPLKDINLIFFYEGLEMIKNRHRAVYKLIFQDFKNETLNETDIGFQLVPMINAVGRINHAKHAVNLFLSNDMTEIKRGVKYLFNINNQRKKFTESLLDLVLPEAQKQYEAGCKSIVLRNSTLHEGIVGILAGKLAERFKRPSFVFGFNEKKGIWKGSGRSTGIVNLYNLTCFGRDHALGFGGHAGAVGVAIPKDNFENWQESIEEAASDIQIAEFYATDTTPIQMGLSEIDMDLINLLNRFRPFGEGFQAPLFKTKVTLNILDIFKEGLHWKCLASDNEGNSIITMFFHDKSIGQFKDKEVEILYTPVMTFGNEGYSIELHGTMPLQN